MFEMPSNTNYVVINSKLDVIYGNNADMLIKFHSAAKPFQMIHFLRKEYCNPFGLSYPSRVILSSSHLGQDIHMQALEEILNNTGIKEEQLFLPECAPTGNLAHYNWKMASKPKKKIYHACSGKHLGFIIRAKELQEPEDIYFKTDSIVQIEAMENIRQFCNANRTIETVRDNCGVPTYIVSVKEIAIAYLNLVKNEPFTTSLLNKYAEYVEGDGSLATELMRKYPVVAKTAINYTLGLGMIEEQIGVAIQTDSWESLSASAAAILDFLSNRNV